VAHQTWDPSDYVRHAGFVAELGRDLINLLAPCKGEEILDLGCGDGALTMEVRASGCSVVAIDSSAEQVRAAAERGLDARVGDGAELNFFAAFDGVISNAALHWMKDSDAVINGVWQALRPGGRFVGEMGAAGNIQTVVNAVMAALATRGIDGRHYNPWFFPSASEYSTSLQARGFYVELIRRFVRPTLLDGDILPWLKIFTQSFAQAVKPAERDDLYTEIAARLEDRLRDSNGRWSVDYVRLQFKARRPNCSLP